MRKSTPRLLLFLKIFIFLIYQIVFAQEVAEKVLLSAQDSLIVNPNYSYNQLHKLLKSPHLSDSIYTKAKLNLGLYFLYTDVKDSSHFYIEKIIDQIKETKKLPDLLSVQEIYTKMIANYIKVGDYKSAFNYKEKHITIQYIIDKDVQQKEIQKLKIQYEAQKKGEEIIRHKKQKKLLAIGSFILFISIIGLLYVYFQKFKTQKSLFKYKEELSNQKINSLLKDQELKMIEASINGQNQERERISQELHDGIGGNLASIKLQLSKIQEKKSEYNHLFTQLSETCDQVRTLSHNLIPSKFKKNEFIALVRDYIMDIKTNSAIDIAFIAYPKKNINEIHEKLKIELFKILQELLANALKHSKAKKIEIHLSCSDNFVDLLFEDDGVGFNIYKEVDGIGLNNIKNRLHNLNGKQNIDSIMNRGTAVSIQIPLI